MKVMSIFGTRPEIIRLSRIFNLLDRNTKHVMVNTSQNYTHELNAIFFKELNIRKPNYELCVKTANFGVEVSEIIKKTDEILNDEKPDILLILGDTNSGLAAIPASQRGITIAHLEAGMRSYDLRMPEEKNRVIIDHLSTILLPYTNYSRENLIRENIHPTKIFVVGNPIIEVINYYLPKIEKSHIMKKLGLKNNDFFLVTAHRSENVDDLKTLENIFLGLEMIHKKHKKRVIYPIHPRTKSKMKKKPPAGIELIEPLSFFDFTKLEKNAFCLITDSGTIPEETLYFKKPCVTIRESTERPETIEAGSNVLAGTNDPSKMLLCVESITSMKPNWEWDKMLGDGKTSTKVLNILSGKRRLAQV